MAFTDRSAQTRAAILAAAQHCFATDGYERATIRAIAADAGTDPSMVIRYFRTKGELYAAASVIDPLVPGFGDGSQAGFEYVRALLDLWDHGAPAAWAVLLRSAATHSEAAQRLQQVMRDQVAPSLEAALPNDPDFELRLALVVSQTFGLIILRYLLCLEPLASAGPETLVATIGQTIQNHLTGSVRP